MASLGHVFIGRAAARLARDRPPRAPGSAAALALWAALSLLPDADVIGMAVGIPYEAPGGHRGATDSLALAHEWFSLSKDDFVAFTRRRLSE